jgi:hypothetical protein
MGLGVPVAVPEANSSVAFGFISTSSNPDALSPPPKFHMEK